MKRFVCKDEGIESVGAGHVTREGTGGGALLVGIFERADVDFSGRDGALGTS